MRKFVAYDSETGGLDSKNCSVLTLTLVALDTQLQPLEILDLKLKPDDGIYRVTAQALSINKINIIEHDKTAITYKEARPRIMAFLARHTNNGTNKLTPIGQNVGFDDSFIWDNILPKEEWEIHVSYRKIDTATIAEFLKICNIVPGSVAGLSNMAKFFGVARAGAHNSNVDTQMTIDLLRAMKFRVTK